MMVITSKLHVRPVFVNLTIKKKLRKVDLKMLRFFLAYFVIAVLPTRTLLRIPCNTG